MISVLYSAGALLALAFLLRIATLRATSVSEKLLLFSVITIPLGKLIYLPIAGFMGLKASFAFASVAGLYGVIVHGVAKRSVALFLSAFLAAISMIWLEDHNWALLHLLGLEGEQTESGILRVIAFVLLLLYCSFTFLLVRRNHLLSRQVARYFIYSTVAACVVGGLIFVAVWNGNLTVEDLAPISADSHIVGNFYRFNPGANVNEFSMILAFAMFLLVFSGFGDRVKILLVICFAVLEFATLTRASWLALIAACAVASLFQAHWMSAAKRYSIIALLLAIVFYLLYISSPEIQFLIESRTDSDIGPSGEDRLDKFSYVFDRVSNSLFRLLLGYGWASNLYVHSVYLQMLYEVGSIGSILFVGSIYWVLRPLGSMPACSEKASLIGIMVFMAVVAALHHNLYHTQTWLMMGFVMAASNWRKVPSGV